MAKSTTIAGSLFAGLVVGGLVSYFLIPNHLVGPGSAEIPATSGAKMVGTILEFDGPGSQPHMAPICNIARVEVDKVTANAGVDDSATNAQSYNVATQLYTSAAVLAVNTDYSVNAQLVNNPGDTVTGTEVFNFTGATDTFTDTIPVGVVDTVIDVQAVEPLDAPGSGTAQGNTTMAHFRTTASPVIINIDGDDHSHWDNQNSPGGRFKPPFHRQHFGPVVYTVTITPNGSGFSANPIKFRLNRHLQPKAYIHVLVKLKKTQ